MNTNLRIGYSPARLFSMLMESAVFLSAFLVLVGSPVTAGAFIFASNDVSDATNTLANRIS